VGLDKPKLLTMVAAFVVALLIAVLAAGPARADPADIAAASRGVVRVVLVSSDGSNVQYVGHGSGFAVAPNLIVTNAHVIAPAREDSTMIVGVVPSEGATGFRAELVAFSPGNDLALLRLTDQGALPPLALFAGAVGDGAEVAAVGYPGNVDLAQGLSLAEIVEPQAAVKSRGYVSAGRSSREFQTLLHTAPVGTGNSGGPLLDGCGRVVGVNSFGTQSEGPDSEFYFAVAMPELLSFLRHSGVAVRTTAVPCRSNAEFDREESERAASERARLEREARARASASEGARAAATHRAELEVLAQRENGMALALLLVVLASAAGGSAGLLELRERRRHARIAAGLGAALLLGAVTVWLGRPSLDSIDRRAAASLGEQGRAKVPASASDGAVLCVFDPQRSRVTVSDAADVVLDWRRDGCVNGRTQYGHAGDAWSRILVPGDEATVSVHSFEPDSRTYKVERFMLDLARMNQLRQARAAFATPACGSGAEAARRFGHDQARLRQSLPPAANERLLYHCRRR